MTKYSLLISFSLLLAGSVQAQESFWSFSTLPATGSVEAVAGSTTGWGYRIENASDSLWLWAYFVDAGSPFVHAQTLPIDFAAVVPPQGVEAQSFDGVRGLLGFRWNADAPDSFVNSGTFTVTAAWYDNDPFDADQPGNLVDEAGVRSAPFSARVAPVPEPGTFCAVGFASLCLWRRRVARS